jgi:hypothetical protein
MAGREIKRAILRARGELRAQDDKGVPYKNIPRKKSSRKQLFQKWMKEEKG